MERAVEYRQKIKIIFLTAFAFEAASEGIVRKPVQGTLVGVIVPELFTHDHPVPYSQNYPRGQTSNFG